MIDYRTGVAATDPRYSVPALPQVSIPVARLATGVVTGTSAAPQVSVNWRWTVAAPAPLGAAAAAPAVKSAVRPATAGTSNWSTAAYRASAVAVTGQTVTALGKANLRYRSDGATSIIKYSANWHATSSARAIGQRLRTSTTRGATASVTASGRSFAVILQSGVSNGSVAIWIDGKHMANVKMTSASSTRSRVAYVATFATAASHQITIVNLSSGAHGVVGFDGLVTLV